MDKKTINYSMGLAGLLLITLGSLNLLSNSGISSDTHGFVASAEETMEVQESVSEERYCPTAADVSSFVHIHREAVNALGTTMQLSRVEISDTNQVERLVLLIGGEEFGFDVDDSYSGFVGMNQVIGDNLSFSDGSLSFNAPEQLGDYSIHFRYFDFNEAILEINTTQDCLPFRSSVVMLPCEDCKVKTIVANQIVSLMLNQGKLAMSFDDFSGSTLLGFARGVDLSAVPINPVFQLIDGLSNLAVTGVIGVSEASGLTQDESEATSMDTTEEASSEAQMVATTLELSIANSFNPRFAERRFVIVNEL